MKTREEVEKLKLDWKHAYGCWDIETTEGFEEYHNELLAYRLQIEKEAAEQKQKRHDALAALVCPMQLNKPACTCMVEKCAWWNYGNEMCAVLMIARAMDRVEEAALTYNQIHQ
jgi:hypothetical protein